MTDFISQIKESILMKHLTSTLLVLVMISASSLHAQTPKLQFSSMAVPAGNGPRSAILVDLDRDGNRDLAVANIRGSTISLISGTGTGSFTLQGVVLLPSIKRRMPSHLATLMKMVCWMRSPLIETATQLACL